MRRPTAFWILWLMFFAGLRVLSAQEVSPEVQTLYEQAQAAQARKASDEAVADYEKIIKLAPDLAPAYNNLGRLYYNLERYKEAAAVLATGLAVAPEMHPAQVMLGAAYFQQGLFSDALGPLEAGVHAMPTDRFARLTLARTQIGLQHPERALGQLQAILETNPKDQEAWYLLGKLHLQLSEQALAQVQALDPNTPLAHELEGEVMESMQNTLGAIAAYQAALSASPEDAGALRHLADLYWHTGDWSHARDYYQRLLARTPGDCNAHYRLANSLDELGEAPEVGMKEVGLALSQCPALAQAHAERARLLLRSHKPAEALQDLEVAQRAAPDESSVQQMFAQAYRALGDRAQADAANQRYLQMEKAQHEAKERHAATVLHANQ